MKLFVPKPPPTSGVMTRSADGSIFITPAIALLQAVDALARRRQRVALRRRVVFADRRARLHVVGDEPIVDDRRPCTMRCALAKIGSTSAAAPTALS